MNIFKSTFADYFVNESLKEHERWPVISLAYMLGQSAAHDNLNRAEQLVAEDLFCRTNGIDNDPIAARAHNLWARVYAWEQGKSLQKILYALGTASGAWRENNKINDDAFTPSDFKE